MVPVGALFISGYLKEMRIVLCTQQDSHHNIFDIECFLEAQNFVHALPDPDQLMTAMIL